MLTSSRSVSFESAGIPSVVRSASSQSVSSRKASHRVPVQILEGHANSVNCVCFCLDEDKLVTGSFENTLRIWNRTTGAVEVLRGHSGKVRDVDVSRDGKMIVSGSNDETVRIWNRELGETMHVCEGHKGWVRSVQFSPDSSRVVSGSKDSTVRVWSAETGNWHSSQSSAMERSTVFATRLAETGSLQGQTASKYGTLKLEVESSHSETRRSSRLPGLLTGRTSSGDARAKSRSGILTPENNYARGRLTTTGSHSHSRLREITWRLAITGATPQPSYSISTGEQIAVLQHNVSVKGIAYSPSGKFIATGCEDSKVYLWEAPVVEDPPAKSSASSFSSFLDRPAVPLAGPSRNNERELDAFWDTLPNRNQQAPPQREPQRVFDKVRNTFTNIFTRRPAGPTQAISQSPVRETVEPVQVAAGRDKVFWVVVMIPTYNAVEKFLYTLIHCRKPEDPDEEVPAATGTDTSQTAADNAMASNQSGHPETADGPENAPTLAGNLVIRTQPHPTAAMRLSGESPSTEPHPSETPACNSQVYNQPESIEMAGIRETSTVSAHASPMPTTSSGPLSPAMPSCEPSSLAADEANRQRVVFHLQEQNEQLRRQLDDAVAAMRKAEAERDGLATGSAGAGPSSRQDGPSEGSRLITDPQAGPSAFSNFPSQGHPSGSAQYISHSIEAEEQANEKGNENALSDPTNKATDSPHSVYPPHHHGPPKNDLTMASSASTAADVANLQRGFLQMQEQLDQLRRRFDDTKH